MTKKITFSRVEPGKEDSLKKAEAILLNLGFSNSSIDIASASIACDFEGPDILLVKRLLESIGSINNLVFLIIDIPIFKRYRVWVDQVR